MHNIKELQKYSLNELISCYEDTTGHDMSDPEWSKQEFIDHMIMRLSGEDRENFYSNLESY